MNKKVNHEIFKNLETTYNQFENKFIKKTNIERRKEKRKIDSQIEMDT